MIVFLWVIFVVSAGIIVVFPVVIFFALGWGLRGTRRRKVVDRVLAPFVLVVLLLTFVGGFSGLLLAVFLDQTSTRIVMGLLGGVLLALGVLPLVNVRPRSQQR